MAPLKQLASGDRLDEPWVSIARAAVSWQAELSDPSAFRQRNLETIQRLGAEAPHRALTALTFAAGDAEDMGLGDEVLDVLRIRLRCAQDWGAHREWAETVYFLTDRLLQRGLPDQADFVLSNALPSLVEAKAWKETLGLCELILSDSRFSETRSARAVAHQALRFVIAKADDDVPSGKAEYIVRSTRSATPTARYHTSIELRNCSGGVFVSIWRHIAVQSSQTWKSRLAT